MRTSLVESEAIFLMALQLLLELRFHQLTQHLIFNFQVGQLDWPEKGHSGRDKDQQGCHDQSTHHQQMSVYA